MRINPTARNLAAGIVLGIGAALTCTRITALRTDRHLAARPDPQVTAIRTLIDDTCEFIVTTALEGRLGPDYLAAAQTAVTSSEERGLDHDPARVWMTMLALLSQDDAAS